ncbi:cation:proton antiporter [Streptacidiphilus sp. P02-A3a]|uniref:cation:proton antiporter n=1 Tax=Streptacidiphilus sp. P02-A3a TaxID=2704468 RepID=UPI0015FB2BE1|nr:cation:proton antiporter [Streptacidiphilus sp. P02-A3a]QMU71374.1 cation/H(+) antiporter [Streptacidiphilus sp. P02-A3a]
MPTASTLATTALAGIALAFAAGVLFTALGRRLGQPAVVGEIVAGICLGPSLLGLLPGDLPARIFPTDIRGYLSVLSQVGLLLFMFVIGWEFDRRGVSGRVGSAATIWISSLLVPLLLGSGLAWGIYGSQHTVGGHTVPFTGFVLFIGVAMSITAFPVLARIVAEHGLQRSPLGTLALGLAAMDDLLAWCMLAVVVAITSAAGVTGFLSVMGWSVLYLGVMLLLVRPLLTVAARRLRSEYAAYAAPLVAAGAFASAYVTARIGLDSIFGAFVFGLVMPRFDTEDRLLHKAVFIPAETVGRLLLPIFFVVTGLSVNLTSLTAGGLLQTLAIIAVACVAKLGAVTLSARLTGMGWRDSTVLGALMNTRGLTELVLLNVGLSIGLLTVQLFTAMVLMALVTTALAAPLLNALVPAHTEPVPAAAAVPEQQTV